MPENKSTLTFITESLPMFFVDVPANFTVQAVGGEPPYTFRLTKNSLPETLTLSKDGTIEGTARTATNTTVDITVTDSATPAASLTQAFNIQVEAQTKTAKG